MGSMCAPSTLNLENVEMPERAARWAHSASRLFPGMSVKKHPVNPVQGSIQGVSLGAGRLWSVLSPPVELTYVPCAATDASPTFSIMVQLAGSTTSCQGRRYGQLERGDFCVIDGLAPFEIEVTTDVSSVIFLQLPRHCVLNRQPGLECRTAEAFGAGEPGAAFLSSVLVNLMESAPHFTDDQRTGALAAVVQLLNVPKLPGAPVVTNRNSRRIQATLAFIDAEYSDSTLSASRVADALGVCRRRLDQILLEELGTSLSAQIWSRRLAQTATDLLDPHSATKTVTQIAFSAGFEDGAHFARAFKRKYRCTPSEWRLRGTRKTLEA